jgi:hypothetical protein
MIFDVAQTPILNMLRINGRLTFNDSMPSLQIHAKYVFVKAGELLIGNETNPFPGSAKIVLYGAQEDQYTVISDATQAGNKILANTNIVKIYGKPRSKLGRLNAEVQKGANTIKVETGLDWVAGDKLGIAANTMRHI